MTQQPDEKAANGTAPWRWLLVIVPVAILIATIVAMVGQWSTRVADPHPQPEIAVREPKPFDVFTDPPAELPSPLPPAPPQTEAAPFEASRVVARIANADVASGANTARMCSACHTMERGAGHRLGPNLWNVVGRAVANESGFHYSLALRGKEGAWTYAELASFLNNPRRHVPGTSMAFAGILNEQRLADVIAHLRTLSDAPAPLPD